MGDIKLALETSQTTEIPPDELLALKTELGGWGLVWQELELIGQPGEAGPPAHSPGNPNPPGQGGEPPAGQPGSPGKGGKGQP